MTIPFPMARLLAALLAVVSTVALVSPRTGAQERAASDGKPSEDGAVDAGSAKESTIELELIEKRIEVPVGGIELRSDGAAGKTAIVVPNEAPVPLEDVLFVRYGHAPRDAPPLDLRLVGGDSIRATVEGGGLERLRLRHAAFSDPLVVPLENVHGIIVPGSFETDAAREDFIARAFAATAETDRLHLVTGDPLHGLVEAFEPSGVRFTRTGASSLLYPWDKIRGLRFAELDDGDDDAGDGDESDSDPQGGARPSNARRGALAGVRLVDGTTIHGTLTTLSPQGARIEHALLGALELPAAWLHEIALTNGRCRFLSDLEPVKVEEHLGSLLVLELPHRKDRSVLGGPLQLDGTLYSKGLGVHAFSRLEFDLGGEYTRFQTSIGLDDSARPPPGASGDLGGAVVFRVFLDGKKLAEEPMSWRDAPKALDLDVSGGKRLTLEVDFGDDPFNPTRDRAAWAQARIVRPSRG